MKRDCSNMGSGSEEISSNQNARNHPLSSESQSFHPIPLRAIPPIPSLLIEYPLPNSEVDSVYIPKNGKTRITPNGFGASETHPRVGSSRGRAASYASDKLRKAKIAERINEIKNNVPSSGNFGQGTQESVLDDAIDYIKYLKLQLQLLSQSRLCGESMPYPFVYLEGFGHYVLNQMACNEPLEDMMGHLLGTAPQAATELLATKGLMLLPRDFAYTLL